MALRRQTLLLLSALVLCLVPLALVPRQVAAAPTYFYVDTTADNATAGGCSVGANGDCSLRQAITAANNHQPATDTKVISFDYYTNGTITTTGAIFVLDSLKAPLPAVAVSNVQIIATTYYGFPLIQINGNGQPVGFQLAGSDGSISGLSLYGFTNFSTFPFLGSAIYIEGARNKVVTSFIGVDPNGDIVPTKQNVIGVLLNAGATGNVIGGVGGETVANFISGNTNNGVVILNSSGNFIQNNYIGLARQNKTTTIVPRPNVQYGIQVTTSGNGVSANNVIGGTDSGLANVIGSNGQAGILLSSLGTTGTLVQANYIGIDKLTNTNFANTGAGVLIENGANGNILGGTTTAPLVISGNTGYGVQVRTNGPVTSNNAVNATTFIGTGIGGTTAMPNALGGILVDDNITGTRIAGTGSDLRIAGNSGPGILVRGSANTSTSIATALVGVVPVVGTGTNPSSSLPNTGGGILIEDATAASVQSSTISGNSLFGLRLSRVFTSTVSGNFVGADLARTGSLPNAGSGIELFDVGNLTVDTNVVTGNLQLGVLVRGATNSNLLANTIVGNSAGGLLLETTGLSLTTGTNVYTNTISGNNLFGLRLSGTFTTTMRKNYVGLNTTFTDRWPNLGNGVEVFEARNTYATDTYVAGNIGTGILISGTNTVTTTFNNTVAGLVIGTNGFTVSKANSGPAIHVTGGASQTTLSSGTLGGDATTVAGPAGVQLDGTSAVTVTFLRIGWVPSTAVAASTPVPLPFGTGIMVTGPLSDIQILSNTLRYNQGPAITVTGNSKRVRMLGNGLSGNGSATALVGTSLLTARPATTDTGSAANPNHDIDPPPIDVTTFTDPLRLRVTDAGLIDGYVITSTVRTEAGVSPVSACISCTIQIFRPGPEASPTSGQGYETLLTYAVGGSALDAVGSFTADANGHFARQIYGGVGASGSQLLLIATDGFGNSSEYAIFPLSLGFTLTNLTGATSRGPGESATYTLRLNNTGSLDLTGLRLQTQGTLPAWGVTTNPVSNTLFTLTSPVQAGSSRLLTVTLTLPIGTNANAQPGLKDVTTVKVVKDSSTYSQAVTLETTVLPRPVLVVSPTVSLGSAKPGETVPHTHVIRNDGNVPVTISITETTIDDVGATGLWATTVSAHSYTIASGGEARVGVEVTVPSGAQVLKANGDPVQAITYLTATVPLSPTGGFGPITLPFSATTQVAIEPDALITDGNQVQDGAATKTTIFTHYVQNLSNRATQFCFVWSTTPGDSTVTFQSLNRDVVIDANGCFSLDTVTDVAARRYQSLQFEARVLVDQRSLPGDTETVTFAVREQTTQLLIGPGVTDRVNVIYGIMLPRIYLPLIAR